MKEIVIATIIVTFVGLALVGIGCWVIIDRINTVARMQQEPVNFEDYVFIMPDGSTFSVEVLFEE